jgi:ubiquitin-like modifier-activating enzyme ATG7
MILNGSAYDKCTACSVHIMDAYREKGHEFVLGALANPGLLEVLTGLEEMKIASDQVDVDMDIEWDE